MHSCVHYRIIYNSQGLEAAQVPKWMKKWWYIYIMEYYSTIKKKDILPFGTVWMTLQSIMLSEISQSEKDMYHMIPHLYVESNEQNTQTNRIETD